jgi:putative salt-induced outer membrane protein YdiY
MPDEFDWIQLVSGEWLKGELVVLYDDEVEFDSDEMDLVLKDWEDITELRSARIVQVRFVDDSEATGRLLLEDGRVQVLAEDGTPLTGARNQFEVLTITAGKPSELSYWSGKLTVGANFRRGNSEQTVINSMLNLKRRTLESRFVLDYLGNYNVTDEVRTANNHRATGTWDWFLTERFFLRPVFFEYFKDPFQNIDYRITIGAGAGYEIIDTAKIDWTAFLGPAYQAVRYVDVEPGADRTASTPVLVVGTNYEQELSSAVDLSFDYRFQITDQEAGRYNHHMVLSLETELTSVLDFDASVVWDRVQEPQPEADGTVPEKDDVWFILGLGIEF